MNPESASDARLRLDDLLVRRGYFRTRSRARDAIERRAVSIAGKIATKPGLAVKQTASVEVDDPARGYVSRAALKLIAGLDHFGIDPAGLVALDIGASTGGFTQVLLERGARTVFAIDVGHGQLDPDIRGDVRVVPIEGLNARDVDASHLASILPQMIVCDVSFISLKLALAPALALAAVGATGVFLVKPQFEAGREAIGKGGILKEIADGPVVAAKLQQWLDAVPGWRALSFCPSPIEGGDGNHEFLLGGIKDR